MKNELRELREAACPLPHELLAMHRDELTGLSKKSGVKNVRVFGSCARGTDGPGSDIDLLVTRNEDVGLLGIAAFAEAATQLLGVEVDVVTDGGLRADDEILVTARDL